MLNLKRKKKSSNLVDDKSKNNKDKIEEKGTKYVDMNL